MCSMVIPYSTAMPRSRVCWCDALPSHPQHTTRRRLNAVAYWTTTVPCMVGWMWQVYGYVPAVVNVR